MTISLDEMRGELSLEQDMVLPSRPDHPEMRESVSVWLFEENGAFAFPRGGIEAEASSWDDRRLQGNFAIAGGRVLNGAGRGPAPSAIDADGRPTVIGAGALTFRCIEPFRRWTMVYDGDALDGSVDQLIAGTFGTQGRTRIRLEADMTMVTPAWTQVFSADTSGMSEVDAANAAAMGLGHRLEHHFRATGTLELDGTTREFSATGTRIHRQSIRNIDGFAGHCWLSAVFPDGRAFGCIAYPPREGGTEYTYNDAVIYQNGRQVPAKIVKAPFLSRIVPEGDDVSVELESEFGRTVIEGKTVLSTFRIGNPDMGGLNLQQSGGLFHWDGQSAYGMVERSRHQSLTPIGW